MIFIIKDCMKKNGWKWFILFIIIVGIIIFLISRVKEKPFNKIEFDKRNTITNKTEVSYYDTILHVGLNELDIKDTYLFIMPFEGASMGEFDLEAYILGNRFQYMVYMKETSRKKAINFLSHELIHLKQYHEGRLEMLDDNLVLWEGEILDGMVIPYEFRPWEREAFDKQNELRKKIKNRLYD